MSFIRHGPPGPMWVGQCREENRDAACLEWERAARTILAARQTTPGQCHYSLSNSACQRAWARWGCSCRTTRGQLAACQWAGEEGPHATPPAAAEAALPPACKRHAGGDYTGVDSLVASNSRFNEFLVLWEGASEEQDLWIPCAALMQDCPDLVLAAEAAWDAAPLDQLPALEQLLLPAPRSAPPPDPVPAPASVSGQVSGLQPAAAVTLARNMHGWIKNEVRAMGGDVGAFRPFCRYAIPAHLLVSPTP
eukprot:3347507-Rhodomonas_salina.2